MAVSAPWHNFCTIFYQAKAKWQQDANVDENVTVYTTKLSKTAENAPTNKNTTTETKKYRLATPPAR